MDAHSPTTTYPRTHESAIAIAGLLAEMGVLVLRITHPDGSTRDLLARHTDLPTELLNAPAGTRVVSNMLEITINIDSFILNRTEECEGGCSSHTRCPGN